MLVNVSAPWYLPNWSCFPLCAVRFKESLSLYGSERQIAGGTLEPNKLLHAAKILPTMKWHAWTSQCISSSLHSLLASWGPIHEHMRVISLPNVREFFLRKWSCHEKHTFLGIFQAVAFSWPFDVFLRVRQTVAGHVHDHTYQLSTNLPGWQWVNLNVYCSIFD